MQFIGTVGSSKADKADVVNILKTIASKLKEYSPANTTIVSGGARPDP